MTAGDLLSAILDGEVFTDEMPGLSAVEIGEACVDGDGIDFM